MRNVILTIILILLPIHSFGQKTEVIDAVKRYNSILIKVYSTLNLNLLKDVATVDEMSRVFPVVQALVNQNSIMVAQQRYFEVRDVQIKGEKAQVITEEIWFYWWQDKKNNTITRAPREAYYKIKYHLIKDKKIWKVDKLEEIK